MDAHVGRADNSVRDSTLAFTYFRVWVRVRVRLGLGLGLGLGYELGFC